MQLLRTLTLALVALIFVGACWTAIARAQQTASRSTAADGVYTEAQATRGLAVYVEQCEACHGATLAGGLGPPLAGAGFLGAWDTLTLADLVDKIQYTMRPRTPTRCRARRPRIWSHTFSGRTRFPLGRPS